MLREVEFKTDSIRELKERVEAFHTLYGKDPVIRVRGNVHCKGYGTIRLSTSRVVSRIGRKYFTATIDGDLEDRLSPTTYAYGGLPEESTTWNLRARV